MNISLPNINVFKDIAWYFSLAKTLVQFERKWHQFASALEEEG